MAQKMSLFWGKVLLAFSSQNFLKIVNISL